MNIYDEASIIITPNAYDEGKIFSLKPTDASGDLTVVRATTKTRFNESHLIESIGADYPALNFPAVGCPRWLLEPQRTNYLLYSTDYSNATWVKNGCTLSSSAVLDPQGLTNATKVTISSNTDNIQQVGLPAVSIGDKSSSFLWVKGEGANIGKEVGLYLDRGDGSSYEAITGTIVLTSSWQQLEVSGTWAIAHGSIRYKISQGIASNPATEFLIWNSQYEVGGYSTSDITTTSATVTRNADLVSKTSISSLIGQTEGSIYFNLIYQQDGQILQLKNGSNVIELIVSSGTLHYKGNNGSAQWDISTALTQGDTYEIVCGYKSNDIVLILDGVVIGTDTSASVPATSALYINQDSSNSNIGVMEYGDIYLFPRRLTDEELQAL